MKKLIVLAIFSAVLCLTAGQDHVKVEPEPPKVVTTTAVPVNPTTQSTTAKPTTAPPTTKPTTTTTTAATTSTEKTTTSAPTTTSTASPTTIKPTAKPKPEVQTWVANYTGTNNTCIVLKMILEIEVPYTKLDNKTNVMANATVLVPATAQASGNCTPGANEQSLVLKWSPAENITDTVELNFQMNKTNHKFTLHSIEAAITPDPVYFPNATDKNTIVATHKKDEFATPVTMSYRCKQNEYLSVPMAQNNTGRFIVSNLQVQAFRNTTSKDFDSARDCEAGETPGIVPIAVGCSLAVLIIIVLIAYLLGRRRSQARGYLSM